MPIQAYGLVTVFALVSLISGMGAARIAGPGGLRWAIAPTLVAFLALWTVGHRLGLVAGPQVELFGFQVSLVLDIAVAVVAAGAAALVQRAALRGITARRARSGVQPAR
jgi:hypothetical protein